MPTTPGWYYQVGEGRVRYWDGHEWSDRAPDGQPDRGAVPVLATTASEARSPNRKRVGGAVVAMVALLALGGAGGAVGVSMLNSKDPATALAVAAPSATATSHKTTAPTSTPSATRPTSTTAPRSTTSQTPRKAAPSVPKAAKPATPAPAKPTPAASTPTAARSTAPVDAFDSEYARVVVKNVLEDIATADERFSDHPELGASSTMEFLSGDMDRLLDAGMPPVKDQAHYYALVTTLGDFYGKASTQLPDDVMGAAATYTVARERTAELIHLLNPVLGTNHALPKWTFM